MLQGCSCKSYVLKVVNLQVEIRKLHKRFRKVAETKELKTILIISYIKLFFQYARNLFIRIWSKNFDGIKY